MTDRVFITECPRDAMQGIAEWIPTEKKVNYLNSLLQVGFDVLDFGSFVSPKAIPQMRDTAEVLAQLDTQSPTKLLAIVANEKGAEQACSFDEIRFLGYPFSVSETFQQRNTHASIEESIARLLHIQNLAQKAGKQVMVYFSMAFGNPYGDEYHPDIVARWVERLSSEMPLSHIALSDTIGSADTAGITELFTTIIPQFRSIQVSAHLHARPEQVKAKTEAAFLAGCRHFDGAIKGFGGCPMAKDDLTGNMDTELMFDWFEKQGIQSGILADKLNYSSNLAVQVFPFA
ncbi:MAG TPA: hydroxymethylglutaryl-CoA lyase [Luteibaculaceae bacterium]|nr:hydroxymethylglutaryl-CoA lyase [Luteibaculaceae bacterium]